MPDDGATDRDADTPKGADTNHESHSRDVVSDSRRSDADPVNEGQIEGQQGDPTETTAELDPTVKKEFAVQVILLNGAIMSFALGAMLLYFRGRVEVGIGLIAIGIVAGVATLRRYKQNAPS